MRKHHVVLLLVSALLITAIVAAEAPSAQAGCFTVRCFNKKIKKLNQEVGNLTRMVSNLTRHLTADEAVIKQNANNANADSLVSCLRRVPLTEYGDPLGSFGYLFDVDGDGTPELESSALDFTDPGDAADVYVLRDTCGTIPVGRVPLTPAQR